MANSLKELQHLLRNFAAERDWGQFHSPKNLACALSVEVAELLEHFQWMPEEQSRSLSDEMRLEIESEVADVFCYLLLFTNELGIDLVKATKQKVDLNQIRYPVNKAKGSSIKYNKL